MTVSTLRRNAAGKAELGRAILIALLAMLVLPARSTEASSSPSGNVRSDNIVWGNSGLGEPQP